MWLWLLVGIGVVVLAAVAAAATVLTVRALRLWRAFRAVSVALTNRLAALEDAVVVAGDKAASAADTSRLERAVAGLAQSRARYAVLSSALADVRAAWTRLAAVYPRK